MKSFFRPEFLNRLGTAAVLQTDVPGRRCCSLQFGGFRRINKQELRCYFGLADWPFEIRSLKSPSYLIHPDSQHTSSTFVNRPAAATTPCCADGHRARVPTRSRTYTGRVIAACTTLPTPTVRCSSLPPANRVTSCHATTMIRPNFGAEASTYPCRWISIWRGPPLLG